MATTLHVFGYRADKYDQPTVPGIKYINTGEGHNILTDTNNNYWVTGFNRDGRCAVDTTYDKHNQIKEWRQITFFKDKNIKICKLNISVSYMCGNTFWITDKGEVYGNGTNRNGQLGLNHYIPHENPTKITALKHVIDIKGGEYYNIALCKLPTNLNINNVILIISHWMAQGDNTRIPKQLIMIIFNYLPIKSRLYSTGSYHNYCPSGHAKQGLKSDENNQWITIKALENIPIVSISCGNAFSLFLTQNGNVYSCGENRYGQLGLGHLKYAHKVKSMRFIEYFSLNKIVVTTISTGSLHSICMDTNGNSYGWGRNCDGQCGCGLDKDKNNINKPEIIKELCKYNIVQLKCGSYHSMAKTKENKYLLFGSNSRGQCTLIEDVNRPKIGKPLIINDIFKEITGKMIKNVYLGAGTIFIVGYTKKIKQNQLEWSV